MVLPWSIPSESLGIDHGRGEKAIGGFVQCTPTDHIEPSPDMFKGNLSKSVSHSFFVNILSYFTQPFLQYNVIYNFCVKKGGGVKTILADYFIPVQCAVFKFPNFCRSKVCTDV